MVTDDDHHTVPCKLKPVLVKPVLVKPVLVKPVLVGAQVKPVVVGATSARILRGAGHLQVGDFPRELLGVKICSARCEQVL